MKPQLIEVNALRFQCLTAGDPDKPMLIFLHGFPEYSGAWAEVIAELDDTFFCVAPDQRGYGGSAKPPQVRDYAAGKLAGDAAALIEHFAPRARAVIGHDWGASVAYALAIHRPELMEQLVIMNGAHPVPFQKALAAGGAQSAASQYFHDLRAKDAEAAFARDDYAPLMATFSKAMDMRWFDAARRGDYVAAWSEPGALTGMLNWYRATPLQVADPGRPIPLDQLISLDPARLRVKPPHLLLWGSGDTALLAEAHEGLDALCDDLTKVQIDGADHWLHHQKPDRVAEEIRAFCGGS